jgi:thioredoxin-dependent peroxiredoxin
MKRNIIILLLTISAFYSCKAQTKHLSIGDTIPQFSLLDQDSTLFNIRDYIGKKILVICFYPKDESSVCTKEACSFRDSFADFSKAGAMVIGINSGSIASHKHFAEHHNLPFTLLSDPDNKVLNLFGVKYKFGITGRETFVADLSGKIVFTFNSFTNGSQHSIETLNYIKTMSGQQ